MTPASPAMNDLLWVALIPFVVDLDSVRTKWFHSVVQVASATSTANPGSCPDGLTLT